MSLLCRLKKLVHKGLLTKEDLDRIVIIPKEQKIKSVTPQKLIHGKCNQCKYYEGVHDVRGHAPCSYHKIGGVMWDWYCSQFESEDMSEVGVEIIKTEENEESGIKYLNINVSNSEVERKPDIVRLCADAGILEYVKPKTGRWIGHREHCEMNNLIPSGLGAYKWCSNCDCGIDVTEWHRNKYNFCPNCGVKMIESQESEDKK